MGDREFYIWLAGFWEGKGCLNVSFSHRKGEFVYCYKNGRRYGPYMVKKDVKKIQVVLTSTNRGILETIMRRIKLGRIYQQRQLGNVRLKRPIYSWRIQKVEEVLLFLKKIKPYLQFRDGEVESKIGKFLEC